MSQDPHVDDAEREFTDLRAEFLLAALALAVLFDASGDEPG